jgi:3-hydroxyisobutyrate dehydrogenase-like beta-hydroxyacid dehydrogenase
MNNASTDDNRTDVPAAHPRVGFVGLGHMGSAMATRLVEAGYDVTVWSRTRKHVDELAERGATPGDLPEDAIATGIVFSMLANEDVVRRVFTPERLREVPSGFVHVNHATIGGAAAEEFAATAARCGYAYVAAPVIGRPNVIPAGNLTLLAAGPSEALTTVRPMLETMGRRVWEYGPVASSANLAKVSVNYLIIHALQALSESVLLLERHGLDTRRFVEMINDSIFPGPVYGGYGHAIVTSTYSPAGFTSVLGLKDLNLALGAADAVGAHLASGPVLKEIFETTVAEIGDDLDWAAVAEVSRRRSPVPRS